VFDVALRREQDEAHFEHTVVVIGIKSGGLEIEYSEAGHPTPPVRSKLISAQ